MTGSNRRPSACKADALPAELITHFKGPDQGMAKWAGYYIGYSSLVNVKAYQITLFCLHNETVKIVLYRYNSVCKLTTRDNYGY